MTSTVGVLSRFILLLFAWFLLFGVLSSAQMCLLTAMFASTKQQHSISRTTLHHVLAHVAGLILLGGGGAFVQGGIGGYIPCANNVTMDRYCMYNQPATYLLPYILHYIGGGYCLVGWFLDGCHLLWWAMQLTAAVQQAKSTAKSTVDVELEQQQPHQHKLEGKQQTDNGGLSSSPRLQLPHSNNSYRLTLFCTPQLFDGNVRKIINQPNTIIEKERSKDPRHFKRCSIPFQSRWHLGAKVLLTVLITLTWMVLVDWSTEPYLSANVTYLVVGKKEYVSLGGLFGILWLEVLMVFGIVSVGLRFNWCTNSM